MPEVNKCMYVSFLGGMVIKVCIGGRRSEGQINRSDRPVWLM